tara:strand:+ start:3642 stop:3920 length:279 start_codon:yes stop_codon:yes gene_type:complete
MSLTDVVLVSGSRQRQRHTMGDSAYTDLERSAYAFALFTVLILDELKQQYLEDRDSFLDFIPSIDVITDRAIQYQLEMLVEDPGIDFDEIVE